MGRECGIDPAETVFAPCSGPDGGVGASTSNLDTRGQCPQYEWRLSELRAFLGRERASGGPIFIIVVLELVDDEHSERNEDS